jgi:EAL domain-containing protein (putative c-di-GMP-specific phosphodiesterase class I)
MSVNLSGKDFTSSLVEDVRHVLDETGLAPGSLRLEITETMVIESPESAAALLAELKGIGVQVYIDDFGTGYSSMNYLQRLPIDALKIDGSFVRRMGSDRETLEIIKTIITLAHALHMDVIAEGVETADQMKRLRRLRCEYAQGCLIARPMDGDSAESFLSASEPHPAPGPASDHDSGAPPVA